MKIKRFNEEYNINDNVRKSNNKIQLLIEYNMLDQNWSAWTEDSYASGLFNLDDYEIEQIQEHVNNFYNEKVKE